MNKNYKNFNLNTLDNKHIDITLVDSEENNSITDKLVHKSDSMESFSQEEPTQHISKIKRLQMRIHDDTSKSMETSTIMEGSMESSTEGH